MESESYRVVLLALVGLLALLPLEEAHPEEARPESEDPEAHPEEALAHPEVALARPEVAVEAHRLSSAEPLPLACEHLPVQPWIAHQSRPNLRAAALASTCCSPLGLWLPNPGIVAEAH